jgi:hypothetical protein
MKDQRAFTRHEFVAIGRLVCLLGMCLSTGAGCDESHAPAMTSSAQSAPSRAAGEVDDMSKDGDVPKDGTVADSNPLPPAEQRPLPAPAETPVVELATKDITFDSLKFDIKAGDAFERSMVPKLTEELHGTPIRIRGYIHPQFAFADTLTDFILTRDSDTCCFGPNRALCDFIVVHMKPGTTANYSLYPIAVEGVFTIEELRVDPDDPEGAVGAIYRLDAEVAR